uniref:Acetyl-CoA carboxylase carboxyltransferase beta subunit n=1 Tax=Acorus gramineus TaxID=55184 RepID=A0A7U0FWJ9_ACOGR|nr:acetyl-CoA carboxylase carboxyltransferase beta subunit [Acorus gramineus]
MLSNGELEHGRGLSKSMDSLGALGNTFGSEDPTTLNDTIQIKKFLVRVIVSVIVSVIVILSGHDSHSSSITTDGNGTDFHNLRAR